MIGKAESRSIPATACYIFCFESQSADSFDLTPLSGAGPP